jgi:hypothetical protein
MSPLLLQTRDALLCASANPPDPFVFAQKPLLVHLSSFFDSVREKSGLSSRFSAS